MAMKSFILIPILVLVFVGTQAEAQLPPLLPPPVSVGTLFNISGIVSCSVNAGVNGTTLAPPFRNASVELSCGGNVIATATTNESGVFVILARLIRLMLSSVLSTCQVNVVTPLSACNATLPSIIPSLEASLRFVQRTLNGTILLSAGPFNITGSL